MSELIVKIYDASISGNAEDCYIEVRHAMSHIADWQALDQGTP